MCFYFFITQTRVCNSFLMEKKNLFEPNSLVILLARQEVSLMSQSDEKYFIFLTMYASSYSSLLFHRIITTFNSEFCWSRNSEEVRAPMHHEEKKNESNLWSVEFVIKTFYRYKAFQHLFRHTCIIRRKKEWASWQIQFLRLVVQFIHTSKRARRRFSWFVT